MVWAPVFKTNTCSAILQFLPLISTWHISNQSESELSVLFHSSFDTGNRYGYYGRTVGLWPITRLVVTSHSALPRYVSCWVWARKEYFNSRCHQSVFQRDQASEGQSSGVSSSKVVAVTAVQYRSKAGGFATIPGFRRGPYQGHCVGMEKESLRPQPSHALAHALLAHLL